MFFDDLGDLARVLVVGTLAYAALVLILRTTGKRTLSKMNAFDLVVTVALGSTLATISLSTSVALVEGVLALALLATLQLVVAWLSTRSATVRSLVKSEPTLLVRDGRMLVGAMRRERVSPPEVLQAVRSQGHARVEHADAVVLETDGRFSVLTGAPASPSALAEVQGAGTRRDAAELG